jgi:AcrR family transcriptional regulator
MSSETGKPDTRQRILEAALELMRRGAAGASLVQIARHAGVSRQAVYLHFADRAALFLALVRHVDAQRDLAGALKRLDEAPTGVAALQAAVDMQADLNPALYPIAAAMDAVRRQDEAMEQAWQDRLANRLRGARAIADRLAAEGALRPGLAPDTAADLVWTMISLRMWEDLVVGRGWTAERYREHIGEALRRALLA